MNLSFRAIHDVVHASAAFSRDDHEDEQNDLVSHEGHTHENGNGDDSDDEGDDSWAQSELNPKNRIDSLEPLGEPLWRIDGSAGFGTQFYAFPLFLENPPPMHIDVFVHGAASYPPRLRKLLDLDKAFHTKDAVRVRRLGIAQYILRILQWNTVQQDGSLSPAVVKNIYNNGPFGSRIVIEGLTCHIRDVRVVFSPNYPLENDLISYQDLINMWDLASQEEVPPEVSISKVRLVRQLHDSISEVYVDTESASNGHNGRGREKERQLVILKSLTSGVKYMYQEMRALLKDIPPHRYVLSRPLHIVTKQCLFGRKRGVIGFTMPYYEAGSLRDILPILRIHGQLHLADQLRWSCQITEAMCHVWHQGHSFYPDLRLDNVVLTAKAPEGGAGLVDFEQRGVWSSFSAPEVDYIENLRILAFDDQEFDFAIPEEYCREYRMKLASCYEAAMAGNTAPTAPAASSGSLGSQSASKRPLIERLEEATKYSNPALSYNVSWVCLTKNEQEAAMVYMLGRLLWCIFEGMSAPHRGAVWQSYPREPELEFPAFDRTPRKVQDLILRCFGDAGAKEQSMFIRQASKLYMKRDIAPGMSSGARPGFSYELVADDLRNRAREFWRGQLEEGEAWLQQRNEQLHRQSNISTTNGSNEENASRAKPGIRHKAGKQDEVSAHGRPTLNQVLRWLQELAGELSYD